MSVTRRQTLGTGVLFLLPLAGCTGFGTQRASIAELEVELVNETADEHVFHVAIETTDGLEEWKSRRVTPNSSDSIVRDPGDRFDPIAIHGIVADHAIRGELTAPDTKSPTDICLHVIFEYGLGDEPTFLENMDITC